MYSEIFKKSSVMFPRKRFEVKTTNHYVVFYNIGTSKLILLFWAICSAELWRSHLPSCRI